MVMVVVVVAMVVVVALLLLLDIHVFGGITLDSGAGGVQGPGAG